MLVASGNSRCGFGWGGIFCPRYENGTATTRLPGMGVHVLSVCAKEAVCVMCGSVRQVVGVAAVRGGRSASMYSVRACACVKSGSGIAISRCMFPPFPQVLPQSLACGACTVRARGEPRFLMAWRRRKMGQHSRKVHPGKWSSN